MDEDRPNLTGDPQVMVTKSPLNKQSPCTQLTAEQRRLQSCSFCTMVDTGLCHSMHAVPTGLPYRRVLTVTLCFHNFSNSFPFACSGKTCCSAMVKKKGGREINPADAFRKTQRAKEIARNKKERKFQRDAFALKAQPDQIRDELADVLDKEQEGQVLSQTLRLKKRALQSAYDAALKKKKVSSCYRLHGFTCEPSLQLSLVFCGL